MNTLLLWLPVTALCIVLAHSIDVPLTHLLLMSTALCLLPL
jgi:hypothetical protein